MFSRNRIFVTALVLVGLVAGVTVAFAEQGSRNRIGNLNLTEEQLNALKGVIHEFNIKQSEIVSDIEHRLLELELECKKEDRFETRTKEKRSVRKVNELVKNISSLHGQLLKTKVEYLLKAKDVLTRQQKEQVISSLDEFEVEGPDDLSFTYYLELYPDLGLDISKEQMKKILRYSTDMQIKELKLKLEIDYKILDLETEVAKDEVDSQKTNNIIMNITDLATSLIDNRVDHFLKGKDVLTVAQREKLLHFIMMTL